MRCLWVWKCIFDTLQIFAVSWKLSHFGYLISLAVSYSWLGKSHSRLISETVGLGCSLAFLLGFYAVEDGSSGAKGPKKTLDVNDFFFFSKHCFNLPSCCSLLSKPTFNWFVIIIVHAPGAPGPPGGIRVMNKTDKSVTLQWSRGADNQSPISKYTIQYRDGFSKVWKNATTCKNFKFTLKWMLWTTVNIWVIKKTFVSSSCGCGGQRRVSHGGGFVSLDGLRVQGDCYQHSGNRRTKQPVTERQNFGFM